MFDLCLEVSRDQIGRCAEHDAPTREQPVVKVSQIS